MANSINPWRIVGLGQVVPANHRHIDADTTGDRSDNWYEIAHDAGGLAVVIDLAPERRGHCYDGYENCYGVAGSMAVVASSFGDLLQQLLRHGGEDQPFWLRPSWAPFGDAYN